MVKVTPPLFDEVPAETTRTCSRWLGDANCGKTAFLHVLWTLDMENGFVCTEHAAELDHRWHYVQAHELGPDCGMPGSQWSFSENVCRCPDEPAAEAAGVGATEAVPA